MRKLLLFGAIIPILTLVLLLTGCYICSTITVKLHTNKDTIGPEFPTTVIFTVELDGTVHDGKFIINFGDGWTARNESGYFRHEYYSTDKYGNRLPSYITVTITYVDERCGSASDTITLRVLHEPPPNRAPVACFTWSPAEPRLFDVVTLNASCAYDPDGEAIIITWEIYNTERGILVGKYTGTERIVYWQTGCEYRCGCSSNLPPPENMPYIPCVYATEQLAEQPMGLEPQPVYIRYLVIATMSDPRGLSSTVKHYIDVRLPD